MREEFERITEMLRDSGGELSVGRLASAYGIKREQLNALVEVFPAELEIERPAQAGAARPAEVVRLKIKSSKSSKSDGSDKQMDLLKILKGGARHAG